MQMDPKSTDTLLAEMVETDAPKASDPFPQHHDTRREPRSGNVRTQADGALIHDCGAF